MPIKPTSKAELFLPLARTFFQTAFLQSVEKPLFEIDAILESFIKNLLPDSAPDSWIPWLYYALAGEDYLRDDFDDTRKRNVLKNLFNLYKSRGTFYGSALHLALLTDFKQLKYLQPPAKAFCGHTLTQAEKDAFYADMPEIRVYQFRHGSTKKTMFVSDCISSSYPGSTSFPFRTDAILRIGDEVDYYDPVSQEAMPLNIYEITQEQVEKEASGIENFALPEMGYGIYLGKNSLHSIRIKTNGNKYYGFTVDQHPERRYYSVEFLRPYQDEVEKRHPLSIIPSLAPVQTYYTEEHIQAQEFGCFLRNRYLDVYPVHAGSFIGHSTFIVDTHPENRLYKMIKLFDPSRAKFPQVPMMSFLGAMRLGNLPKFTGEIWIDMIGKAKPGAMFVGNAIGGFPQRGDADGKIELMEWAVQLSRAAGVEIWAKTTVYRTVRAGTGIMAGEFASGQSVLDLN